LKNIRSYYVVNVSSVTAELLNFEKNIYLKVKTTTVKSGIFLLFATFTNQRSYKTGASEFDTTKDS